MLILSIRAVLLYLMVLIAVRIMGKRELGQLQPYEVVITLLMANLAATPITDIGIPLLYGAAPILALLLMYLVISWLMLKIRPLHTLMCGRPTLVISEGRILESEMRRVGYNLDDLLHQLRAGNTYCLQDVQYGILETSGMLTIIPKPSKRPVTAGDLGLEVRDTSPSYHIIMDGRVDMQSLMESGHTMQWLMEQLNAHGYTHPRQIFLGSLDRQGQLILQPRQQRGRWLYS